MKTIQISQEDLKTSPHLNHSEITHAYGHFTDDAHHLQSLFATLAKWRTLRENIKPSIYHCLIKWEKCFQLYYNSIRKDYKILLTDEIVKWSYSAAILLSESFYFDGETPFWHSNVTDNKWKLGTDGWQPG